MPRDEGKTILVCTIRGSHDAKDLLGLQGWKSSYLECLQTSRPRVKTGVCLSAGPSLWAPVASSCSFDHQSSQPRFVGMCF